MKKIIVLYSVLCMFWSATFASKTITMIDIPLTWNDFTPTQNTIIHEHGAALISVNTQYQWNSQHTSKTAMELNFRSEVTVNKKNSFVSAKFLKTTDSATKMQLLNHEKGHYIIGLIKNIWLKEAIQNYAFRGANLKATINAIHGEVEARAAALNKAYDEETHHSLDVKNQEQWEIKLLKQLNEMTKYSGVLPTVVSLKLNLLL